MTEPSASLGRPRSFGPGRRELFAFAELLAASSLAVAQPMFDVAAENTELFSTRHVSPSGIVVFTLVVLLVPPIALLAIEVLVGVIASSARRYAHAALVAIPIGVWVLGATKHSTELGARALVVIGASAALLSFVVVLRIPLARTFLRTLALVSPVFALLFLFASPVGTVVFEADAQAAAVTVAHPHRVVWIVLDELPLTSLLDGSGHVDAELFPNFAALADTSTWYRNSTTVAPYTVDAVPALLTGKIPAQSLQPAVLANHPDNAFTLLGRHYAIHAHETLTALCPAGLCRGDTGRSAAPRGTADALGGAIRLWGDFIGPDRSDSGPVVDQGLLGLDPDPVATARNFVAGIRSSSTPSFDFLHLMLPHTPWHYRATLQDDGDALDLLGWVQSPWASRWSTIAGRQRHLLQVQATDTLLGSVMRKLARVGAWDDTLVIVTADHGMGFSAGDSPRGLSEADIPDLVWTPLFVKYPGQSAGRVDDRPARSVDVLPTVADVLGIRMPWKVAGRSLRDATRDGTPGVTTDVSVLSWPFDTLHPAPGSRFNVVDGRKGFAAVLTRRAAPAGGDPALRIYRVGPYGALVGRTAAPLVAPVPSKLRVTTGGDPRRFDGVDLSARHAPWLAMSGAARPNRGDVPMAVAVNGTIAGVTETVAGTQGAATWWATLVPGAFHEGRNDVRLYEIVGGPTSPRLEPIRAAG